MWRVIHFDVRSNIPDIRLKLGRFPSAIEERALQFALTATAMDVKAAEIATMRRVFQNPVSFTLNSLFVRAATKRTKTATVYFKDFATKGVPAGRYLRAQIEGGLRSTKSSERELYPLMRGHKYLLPGPGAVLNMHGNMSGGFLTKVLSQVRMASDPLQNATGSRRSRAKRRAEGYFIPRAGHPLPGAVYKRQGKGVIPVLLFKSNITYRKRFPFYEVAQQITAARFPSHYERELKETFRRVFGKASVPA